MAGVGLNLMDWQLVIGFIAIVGFSIIICLIYDRLRRPWQARKATQLAADIKSGKISLEKSENGVISITEAGFIVSGLPFKQASSEIKWTEIDQILAYKRDLFTTDLICWVFHSSERDINVEVHEEMLGFKALQEIVGSRFDIKLGDWFRKVAFPPFAPSVTKLWPKGEDNQHTAAPDGFATR